MVGGEVAAGETSGTAIGAHRGHGVALQCEGLVKRFGGLTAVDDMSLEVRANSITGLIGPNGAGKSTLFNLVSRVIPADAGRVTLFGRDVSALRPHQIAGLGMIRTFQLSREMNRMTALENLMLSAPNQIGEGLVALFTRPGAVRAEEAGVHARALEVLDIVGLARVGDEYAGDLSGGQKKLLELGRALMIDADLILLDEPGAGVNPALMGTLTQAIADLCREHGKTILIVEHDMALIDTLCDHVVVMAEGARLTEGSFEAVSHDPRVIEAYLGKSA